MAKAKKTKKRKPVLGHEFHISTFFHNASGAFRARVLVGTRHQGSHEALRMKPVGDGVQSDGQFESEEAALAAAKKQLGLGE